MRSRTSVLALVSWLSLSMALFPAATSAQYATVLVPGQGQVFCPSAPLTLGSVVIPAGNCFKLAAYRDAGGSYLGFLPPTAPIAPGQVVSVSAGTSNPNGPFFLMPVSASAALAVNTMALVPARFETRGQQTRIVLMGGALANTIVTVAQPAAPVVVTQPAPAPAPAAANAVVVNEGQVFCPSVNLVAGGVVIPQGDCYRLALLRNMGGTFLVFVPQGIALPAGRFISLNAPGMGMLASRAYLVPASPTAPLPMNTLITVPATIGVAGGQEVITLTGGPAPNTVIRLGRRP